MKSEAELRRRGYVICSEHRSGSTLLCELLASTGKLGIPDEVFRHPDFSAQVERDPALLEGLIDKASSPNGIYGLKIFSQQFDVSSRARWTERLPNLRFIHLQRNDLLAQAISLVRALQTDQYFAMQNRKSEPRYDGDAIRRHLTRIAEGHMRWRCYFARNGIDVLSMAYEEIAADPERAVAAVASHLQVNEPLIPDLSLVNVTVQRDRVSEEWRARFIQEAGDLNYLDHPLGRSRVWLRRVARDVGLFRRSARHG